MGLLKRFREWRERRNEKWHIISSHSELPIGKYLRIMSISNSEEAEIDKSTSILQELTGWSAEDVENMSLVEYSALLSGCTWLYEQVPMTEVASKYKVGDYTLRPTLADRLTFAQYIDFQTYAKDMEQYIIELLSVLLVPEGKHYNSGYSIEHVKKHIALYLPTDAALSLIAFFLKNAAALTETIPLSLARTISEAPAKTEAQKEQKARAMAMVEALRKNGVGL